MSAAPDLPGFDPADSTTWHPAHDILVTPMQRVANMLGVRLGTDLAPATEYLARTLYPDGMGSRAVKA